MSMKIALAGNPNSGKTTMFNALTGSSQYVGNWPGVTVEKKEGKLKGNKEVIIQDLPGIYSLSPYTPEEVVSRNYLVQEKPDAIINIVDASNIERNLYLTTQLMDIGVPVVLALNMMDIIEKNGDKIDVARLEKTLGCPVVQTAAIKNTGCMEAVEKAIELGKAKKKPQKVNFSANVENALKQIEQSLAGKTEDMLVRWYAIKLFERDEKIQEQLSFDDGLIQKIEDSILACEAAMDDDSESIIINERYEFIGKTIDEAVHKSNQTKVTTSDKIDQIVTNRILALPIFVAIMFFVYFISISTVGTFLTDWVNEELFGEVIAGGAEELLESVGAAEWLSSLIVDGVIEGVGAVLGFLPQMLVLFLCLAILEDCGYMARIAFIMDRFFRRFGLSGKSFIPILVGTGCGVPGVMASRTIESERDRKITIMTTTFIPCAAKLPIIALIAGAMFNNSAWVASSAYFLGIAAIIVSGIILKKTTALSGDAAPFVMELPQYHVPTAKGILIHMWDRGKSFVKKAGTIIFLSCILIWFLTSFDFSLQMVDADESIMAVIAGIISPIFSPLGWGDWQSTVATITGLIAKENVVSTFGILFGHVEEISEEGIEIWGTLATHYASGLAAYSFLAFNLLCAPCFAAIGAIHREMASVKWTLIAVGYQTVFAYIVALIIFQFGSLYMGAGISAGSVAAIISAVVLLFMLFRPKPQNKQVLKAEQKAV